METLQKSTVAIFYNVQMLGHKQHEPLSLPSNPAYIHHEKPLRIQTIYEHLVATLSDHLEVVNCDELNSGS